MSNNNLKNATMAAVLTAVIVTPVFGLQLIRQGARTSMESHWSLVAIAAAVVFVFQLLRPGSPSRSRSSRWACRRCRRPRPRTTSC